MVGAVAAAPQQADDLQRLTEQLVSFAHVVGETAPHDMLVEPFTGTHARDETAIGDQSEGGRGLRDDLRVAADHRARRSGHQRDTFRRGGDRAQHRPGEGGVPLDVESRVVVIAHSTKSKPAASARTACRMSSRGPKASDASL